MKFWQICCIFLGILVITFVATVAGGTNDQQGSVATMTVLAGIGTAIVWFIEEIWY